MRAAGSELARKPTSIGGCLRPLIPSETSASRFFAMLLARTTLQWEEGLLGVVPVLLSMADIHGYTTMIGRSGKS